MESIRNLIAKNRSIAVLGVISLFGAIAACGHSGLDQDPGPKHGYKPGDDPELMSILETADAAGDFTILLAALEEAGLAPIFADDDAGPFTVFAPTDDAFLALLEALDVSAEELLARDDLGTILKYHVVAGKLLEDDVRGAILSGDGEVEVVTLAGESIEVTLEGETVVINGVANVVATDVRATNGVIHVIDAVLLPPAKPEEPELMSILETADAAGNFTVLLAALEAAGLAPIFADDDAGPFTVFAPTDDAFAALLAELEISAAELLASEDLGTILQYHVVAGKLLKGNVLAAICEGDGLAEVETLAGMTIAVTLENGTIVINGVANVVAADIRATNGVIHVIDAVLLPPAEPEEPEEPELMSILETAAAAGNFTILLAALEATGLAPIFADDDAGLFTVFAPTDDAFAALLAALEISAAELLAREDLGAILQYHVLAGKLLKGNILGAICDAGGLAEVETLSGESIQVAFVDGMIVINGVALVVAADIRATNGVIHAIDTVLLPSQVSAP